MTRGPSEPEEIPWEKAAAKIAALNLPFAPILTPIRALRWAEDDLKLLSLSDDDYRAKRVEEGRWVPD